MIDLKIGDIERLNPEEPSSPDLLSLGLSAATVPWLLALTALEHLSQSLIELGQTSEEIFRGERMPILNSKDRNQSN